MQHLTPAKSKEQVSLKEAQRQLLQIFTADPEMAFLQKSPSFQQLLHEYNL
ncbi:Transcriptional regulator, Xre family [Lacticaseibacillus paracasei subsp. paracasei Lpp120]|nr:Transcriptional regulator, Xre family [Lacticaseibacillus paracasei subsp. paracasei Lpp120]